MGQYKTYKSWEAAGITFAHTSRVKFDITCPECSHTRKREHQKLRCLNINQAQRAFRCNHCDWGGRIIDEIDRMERQVSYEAKQYTLPARPSNPKLNAKWIQWFETERYISEATLERFGIYNDAMWHRKRQEKVSGVCLPYIKGGQLVNIKRRSMDKEFTLESGAELTLFNIDSLLGQREAIITEGELGALSWYEAGWRGGLVSVPNGVPLSEEEKAFYNEHKVFRDNHPMKMDYLDNAWDELAYIETFYLAVDDDIPGRKLRHELIRRLGAERCKIITFRGQKDEGELVQKEKNRFVLLDLVKEATELPIDGVIDADSVWSEMLDIYDNGLQKGLTLGIDEFTGYYSLRLGELDVLTGLPNHGKTTFMLFYIALTAVKHNWRWAIYCPESMTAAQLMHQLVQAILGKTAEHGGYRMKRHEYNSARRFLQEHIFILDAEYIECLDDAMEKFELLVRRKGVNACCIDPWNDIIPKFLPGEREDQYLQRQPSMIRKFNKRNNTKFLINAHPSNLKYKNDEDPPVAKPSVISGGGMWFARADNIYTYYRNTFKDPLSPIAELHIFKIKHQDLVGKPTGPKPILLEFDWTTRRFKGKESRQTMPDLGPEWTSHYTIAEQTTLDMAPSEKAPDVPYKSPNAASNIVFEESQTLAPMGYDGRQTHPLQNDPFFAGIDMSEEPPF